jgi:ABC-type polysaccharide/polyol phosphate transport system ATPase subunit
MAGQSRYAITARDLSVKYDVRLTPDRTLRRTVAEFARHGRAGRSSAFWALRDVSFDLSPGEILGVVGANGSGKSTLLLAVAGIIRPSAGVIYVAGGTPTLLTLMTGFEGDLTGRQNIVLNAAYLGYSHEAIRARMHEIVDFAGLGDFIDAPLRTYSTGMRTRLAFSVAVHVEPEVLLLDEVLGVGDAQFHRKSLAKLSSLMESATAMLVATHDMQFVTDACAKALWLRDGRVAGLGDPRVVVEQYLDSQRDQPAGPDAQGVRPVNGSDSTEVPKPAVRPPTTAAPPM